MHTLVAPDIKRKINACQQAITEKGAFEQIAMQGILFGCARSGKTSSKKRLVGKKPQPHQASTGVAEKVARIEIEKTTVYSSWIEVSELSDETAIVVEDVVDHVSYQIQPNAVQPNTSPVLEKGEHTTHDSPGYEVAIISKEQTSKPLEGKEVQAKRQRESTPTNQLQILKSALQAASAHSLVKRKGRWTMYLSDVGGQPEFQEMLPSLVSGPSIYFLTFPLHKGLNERYIVEYQHPSKGLIESPKTTSSYQQRYFAAIDL